MPASRTFNGTSAAVSTIANQALANPEGLTLEWLTATYGAEAAASLSRAFQSSFNALRARARRLSSTSIQVLDLETRGPYDVLGCARYQLPDGAGWAVDLKPGHTLLAGVVIKSGSTGEVLNSPKEKQQTAIVHKALTAPHTVTQEEYDFVEREFNSWLGSVEEDGTRPRWFAPNHLDIPA